MAKRKSSVDEVVKGKHYKHLGHFRNKKILKAGHNTTRETAGVVNTAQCMRDCKSKCCGGPCSGMLGRRCETQCTAECI